MRRFLDKLKLHALSYKIHYHEYTGIGWFFRISSPTWVEFVDTKISGLDRPSRMAKKRSVDLAPRPNDRANDELSTLNYCDETGSQKITAFTFLVITTNFMLTNQNQLHLCNVYLIIIRNMNNKKQTTKRDRKSRLSYFSNRI